MPGLCREVQRRPGVFSPSSLKLVEGHRCFRVSRARCEVFLAPVAEAHLRVHEAVEADGALGQHGQAGFLPDLGEGVEQAPRGLVGGEFGVARRAPFLDDRRNLLKDCFDSRSLDI